MKKIVIDCRMLGFSGIGVYLRHMLDEILKCEDFEFILLGTEKALDEFKEKRVEIIPCEIPVYSLKELFILPLYIPSCDIFWSPHLNIPLMPVKTKKRVTTIHDMFFMRFYDELSPAQKIYTLIIFTAIKLSGTEITTVSEFSRKEICDSLGIKMDRILVCGNSIDRDLFYEYENKTEIKEQLKNKYDIKNDFLLYVGNMKKHKNVLRIIEAYSKIAGNFKNLDLVMIGSHEKLRNKCNDLKEFVVRNNLETRIRFIENVDFNELPQFYNIAEIFMFPTLYEGFGIPSLEAMSCGTPVISSEIEIIEEICGDAVYKINPLDSKEIAEAVIKILNDNALRDDLIKRGKKRVKRFSWERSSIKLLKFFRSL